MGATSQHLRNFVDQHRVLRHPFLALVTSGEAGPEQLVAWGLQERHVSYAFPRSIGLLISCSDDFRMRTVLAENLWEEFGEGDPDQAHAVLLDNLLVSMGVAKDRLDRPPTEGTLEFLRTQRELTTSSAWRGVGAFCYANEYLSLAEFRPLEDAVRSQFPAADLAYFTENMKADTRHTELLESLIDAAAEVPSHRADILYGVGAALDARCRFYDALAPRTGA
ncbi:iron-containing redox enzyme family protein [Streptomyces sp. V4-01]|uniref:Iron-containing redox enzyme family protein n=1 Tax=Actinacidiphila polyblastidii TaxID=3110430 RepID=A0ABU7PB56_9ACTN|nr:iron-containing redox enzyme family protein [Streptomyces sp. V4-01]